MSAISEIAVKGKIYDVKDKEAREKAEELGIGLAEQKSIFGVEETVLAEQTVSFVMGSPLVSSDALEFSLAIGEKYRVLWDGTEYFCTAKDASELSCNGLIFKGIDLGNAGLFNSIAGEEICPDTGEPFLCLSSEKGMFMTADTAESHTICVQKIKTLDREWMSDNEVATWLIYEDIDGTITISLDGNVKNIITDRDSPSNNFSEIVSAIDDNFDKHVFIYVREFKYVELNEYGEINAGMRFELFKLSGKRYYEADDGSETSRILSGYNDKYACTVTLGIQQAYGGSFIALYTNVKERYTNAQIDENIKASETRSAVTVTEELHEASRHFIVKQGGTEIAKIETMGKLTGDQLLSWLMTDYVNSTVSGDYSVSLGFSNISKGNGNVVGGLYNNVVGRALGVFGGANRVKKCAIGAIIGGRHAGVNDDTVVFAIGNGTSDSTQSLAHTLDLAGNAWFAGAVQSTGADYAEYFEWADENPNKEDRTGLFVALEGDKAVIANETSDIIGVVSAAPAIIGDSYERQWMGMYVTDIYGRVVYEDVEVEKEYTTFDDEGNEVTTTQTVTEHRPKLNPDYDAAKEYIPRSKRPEWATVGFLGKLVVMDDGTCVVGSRCSCGKDGIATDGTAYRVLKRLDESHVMILASFL